MTSSTVRSNMLARDQKIVELCLPAHMLILMLEQCAKQGVECRSDVVKHLNVASIMPLTKLDQFSIARLAKRIDDVATTLLHDLSPDDPREGLYCVSVFCLKLVEEGYLGDKTNQALLGAALFLDDVKDDRPDEEGRGVVWGLKERRWEQEAFRLLNRALLMGLYARDPVQATA